tara:strand:+ start:11360 stop:11782 length:423 start_codon:yes stop_codon:yes gene_type:complete
MCIAMLSIGSASSSVCVVCEAGFGLGLPEVDPMACFVPANPRRPRFFPALSLGHISASTASKPGRSHPQHQDPLSFVRICRCKHHPTHLNGLESGVRSMPAPVAEHPKFGATESAHAKDVNGMIPFANSASTQSWSRIYL